MGDLAFATTDELLEELRLRARTFVCMAIWANPGPDGSKAASYVMGEKRDILFLLESEKFELMYENFTKK